MNSKKKISLFFAYFFTLYCGLLYRHYALDTYSEIFASGVSNWGLSSGRYSSYVLSNILNLLNISPRYTHQQLFVFISIILMAVVAGILYDTISKCINISSEFAELLLMAIIGLALGNVYITECHLFPEFEFHITIGAFLVILSIKTFEKDAKSVKSVLLSLIFLILSIGFYQTYISWFLIMSSTILMCKSSDIKNYLKNIGIMLLVAAIASAFNIFITKVFVYAQMAEELSRSAQLSIRVIIDNIQTILESQVTILGWGSGLLPKWSLLLVIIFAIVGYIFCCRKEKLKILIYLITIFLQYVCAYAPHLISKEVWMSPRTITPVFIFVAGLYILLIDKIKKNKLNYSIVGVVLLGFFAIDFWSVQGMIQNHIATNKIDQNYAYDIYSEIKKYEAETGNTVNNIASVNDINISYGKRYIDYVTYDINISAFATGWSDSVLINFVSGRNFNKIAMDDEVYKKHFEGKDWDYYCPEEQLFFEGDTLFWCKY